MELSFANGVQEYTVHGVILIFRSSGMRIKRFLIV